jgi:serpin B
MPANSSISPLAIFAGLSLLRSGAETSTASELKRALHFDGTAQTAFLGAGLAAASAASSGELSVKLVTRLFAEKSRVFAPAFIEQASLLGAPLQLESFKQAADGARDRINRWVSEETRGRVPDLLPPGSVSETTRLVLANALALSAAWTSPFDDSQTTPASFHLSAKVTREVPTLHGEGQYAFANVQGIKLLDLGYVGDAFSMLLVLPNEETDLRALESQLRAATLEHWAAQVKPTAVRVSLPKFSVETPHSWSASASFKALGVAAAFDSERADFSLITGSTRPEDRLFVSDVFHRALVTVDEKGTQAVAASALMVQAASAQLPTENRAEFKADRPFLFFIRHKGNGAILFIGRVAEPVASITRP